MQTKTLGTGNHSFTVEQGPNWVQGTQTGNGPANPILLLTEKHGVKTQFNDLEGSLSQSFHRYSNNRSRSNHVHAAFYDFNGLSNFSDTFNDEDDAFTDLTIGAGTYLFRF